MTDVLVFVEDPGAANFVAELPAALAARGLTCRLVVAGPSASYLTGFDAVVDGADADELLDEVAPAVVVVGTAENPDTLALPLVAVARRRGIPAVGAVDGPDNAALRFRGRGDGPMAHAPDWLLVADSWTRDKYVALGFDPASVVVTGHPHHDRVRAAARAERLPPSWAAEHDGTTPVVLFAAERSTGLDPAWFRRADDFTLVGRGHAVLRTDIVIEEFLDAVAALPDEVFTVLRLHPKNDPDEFDDYVAEFDHVSSAQPSLVVLPAVDAVVGLTSMLLEEGVILGVPTLSIVPRERERHLSTSVELGLTPCVWTRDDARTAVAQLVRSPRPAPAEAVEAAYPAGSRERAAAVIERLVRG